MEPEVLQQWGTITIAKAVFADPDLNILDAPRLLVI